MAKTVSPDDRATKGAAPPKVPKHQLPVAAPPAITANDPRFAASDAANPYAAGANGTYFGGPPNTVAPDDPRIQASKDANPLAAGANGTPFAYGSNAPGSPAATDPTADPSVDWAKAFFGALGLPDDVMTAVTKILRDHAQDQTLARAFATQYIRSTSWYQVHYPGALEGIANGTIQDEAGYTQYMHSLNALSQQYQGRAVSGDEVKGYLQAGYDTSYVGKLYGGQAWVAANRQDTQYTLGAFGDNGQLDSAGLTTLGNENAGIDTGLGQRYAGDLQKATDRFRRIFQGTLAQGSTTGLQRRDQAAQTPDVGA